LAILDELLLFKFDNRHLIAARELAGSGLLQSPHYTWMRDTLRTLIGQTGAATDGHVHRPGPTGGEDGRRRAPAVIVGDRFVRERVGDAASAALGAGAGTVEVDDVGVSLI